MEKFFKYLYNILSSKIFKVAFVIFILCSFFYYHYNGNFNKDKFADTIELIKEDKTQDKFKNKIGDALINKVVKKQIVISDKSNSNIDNKEEDKIETKEENVKINKITNILLKMKELETNYKYNLENNKLDRDRIIKTGDYIYYSMKTIFNNDFNDPKSPEMRLFMSVEPDDSLSSKLIGKKLNQKVVLNYKDIIANAPKADRDNIERIVNKNIQDMNKNYGQGQLIFKNNNVIYELTALDFISGDIMEELDLKIE